MPNGWPSAYDLSRRPLQVAVRVKLLLRRRGVFRVKLDAIDPAGTPGTSVQVTGAKPIALLVLIVCCEWDRVKVMLRSMA